MRSPIALVLGALLLGCGPTPQSLHSAIAEHGRAAQAGAAVEARDADWQAALSALRALQTRFPDSAQARALATDAPIGGLRPSAFVRSAESSAERVARRTPLGAAWRLVLTRPMAFPALTRPGRPATSPIDGLTYRVLAAGPAPAPYRALVPSNWLERPEPPLAHGVVRPCVRRGSPLMPEARTADPAAARAELARRSTCKDGPQVMDAAMAVDMLPETVRLYVSDVWLERFAAVRDHLADGDDAQDDALLAAVRALPNKRSLGVARAMYPIARAAGRSRLAAGLLKLAAISSDPPTLWMGKHFTQWTLLDAALRPDREAHLVRLMTAVPIPASEQRITLLVVLHHVLDAIGHRPGPALADVIERWAMASMGPEGRASSQKQKDRDRLLEAMSRAWLERERQAASRRDAPAPGRHAGRQTLLTAPRHLDEQPATVVAADAVEAAGEGDAAAFEAVVTMAPTVLGGPPELVDGLRHLPPTQSMKAGPDHAWYGRLMLRARPDRAHLERILGPAVDLEPPTPSGREAARWRVDLHPDLVEPLRAVVADDGARRRLRRRAAGLLVIMALHPPVSNGAREALLALPEPGWKVVRDTLTRDAELRPVEVCSRPRFDGRLGARLALPFAVDLDDAARLDAWVAAGRLELTPWTVPALFDAGPAARRWLRARDFGEGYALSGLLRRARCLYADPGAALALLERLPPQANGEAAYALTALGERGQTLERRLTLLPFTQLTEMSGRLTRGPALARYGEHVDLWLKRRLVVAPPDDRLAIAYRQQAAAALGALLALDRARPQVIAGLEGALADPAAPVRLAAAEALLTADPEHAEARRTMTATPRDPKRIAALGAPGRMEALTHDPDPAIRMTAAQWLVHRGPTERAALIARLPEVAPTPTDRWSLLVELADTGAAGQRALADEALNTGFDRWPPVDDPSRSGVRWFRAAEHLLMAAVPEERQAEALAVIVAELQGPPLSEARPEKRRRRGRASGGASSAERVLYVDPAQVELAPWVRTTAHPLAAQVREAFAAPPVAPPKPRPSRSAEALRAAYLLGDADARYAAFAEQVDRGSADLESGLADADPRVVALAARQLAQRDTAALRDRWRDVMDRAPYTALWVGASEEVAVSALSADRGVVEAARTPWGVIRRLPRGYLDRAPPRPGLTLAPSPPTPARLDAYLHALGSRSMYHPAPDHDLAPAAFEHLLATAPERVPDMLGRTPVGALGPVLDHLRDLPTLPSSVVQAVVPWARQPDARVARAVAPLLAVHATTELVALADDPRWFVRRTAGLGAGWLPEGNAALIDRLLDDPDPRVREATMQSLGEPDGRDDGAAAQVVPRLPDTLTMPVPHATWLARRAGSRSDVMWRLTPMHWRGPVRDAWLDHLERADDGVLTSILNSGPHPVQRLVLQEIRRRHAGRAGADGPAVDGPLRAAVVGAIDSPDRRVADGAAVTALMLGARTEPVIEAVRRAAGRQVPHGGEIFDGDGPSNRLGGPTRSPPTPAGALAEWLAARADDARWDDVRVTLIVEQRRFPSMRDVVERLIRTSGPRLAPALHAALDTPFAHRRRAAVRALAELHAAGHPVELPSTATLLGARTAATTLVAGRAGADTADLLYRLVRGDDGAARALAERRDPRVVPSLNAHGALGASRGLKLRQAVWRALVEPDAPPSARLMLSPW